MTRESFPKESRVLRGEDFTQIIRRGTYASDTVLVVNVRRMKTGDGRPRLGITVSKKTGSAVVRNRWKRWIREAFRRQRDRLPSGIEIIVRPKRDADGSFRAIESSLPETVARAARKLAKVGRD